MVFKDHEPVLLPDLRNDPRLSEEAREFYRAASIVSGATFPLILQDEVVGLLRVGSLRPTSFAPQVVGLLESLAVQAAVVVKGVQLWEQLQRSRKETEDYAARVQASMEIEHHLARVDHLCGIPNRRYLDEVVAAECARTARYKTALSLAMADLDEFKLVNDTHGHGVGDDVLRQVAAIARSGCREGDLVGRMGGDEFLFVLTATDLEGAVAWADRFRLTLEKTPLFAPSGTRIHLTVSVGVTEADSTSLASPGLLLRRCDQALYDAKASGRNAVRWYQQPLAEAV
jgi:diguanylate cyclase (GGDEF)-like protein